MALATNPYDTRFNRESMSFEVIDTRDGQVCDFFFIEQGAAEFEAERRAAELWHDELMRAPVVEVNVFGETVPTSNDEALARQLVNEINELEEQRGELRSILDRYDVKSAQVRALGFEIAPGPDGRLCVADPLTRRPLAMAPVTNTSVEAEPLLGGPEALRHETAAAIHTAQAMALGLDMPDDDEPNAALLAIPRPDDTPPPATPGAAALVRPITLPDVAVARYAVVVVTDS